MKIAAPYKPYPLRGYDNWRRVSAREVMTSNGQDHICIWYNDADFYAYDGNYNGGGATKYKTEQEARDNLDKALIGLGYELVSEERFEKLKLLQ